MVNDVEEEHWGSAQLTGGGAELGLVHTKPRICASRGERSLAGRHPTLQVQHVSACTLLYLQAAGVAERRAENLGPLCLEQSRSSPPPDLFPCRSFANFFFLVTFF